MAHQTLSPCYILCLFFLFAMLTINVSQAANISVYWGQNGYERSLLDACKTGKYDIVNIAYLSNFGNGQKMTLNLSSHCDPNRDCFRLSSQINECQNLGIKVFLSIGGRFGNYSLSSPQDARGVATYIWNNYLGGYDSASRSLGYAALDGVDFDISLPTTTTKHWDILAKALSSYSRPNKRVYLSAAVGCSYPDRNLDAALQTGLFDYVWVKFYNDRSCEYGDNLNRFLRTWDEWKESVQAKAFYIGLTPTLSVDSGYTGFISIDTLIYKVLPTMDQYASKYDGVMISSRYWDVVTDYSTRIRDYDHVPSSFSY